MATLYKLWAGLSDADSATYAATGEHSLRLTPRQRVQHDGCSEVQVIAVERDRQGRVTCALCWDGTRETGAWQLRTITTRHAAEFCGIVDHGYA